MKTYFLSDIHLSVFRHDYLKEEKLLKFLDLCCEPGNQLYLVGDIFDFWFEWYYVIPKAYFRLFFKLKKMVDIGVKIFYVPGNHDFYLGSFFEKDLGIIVTRNYFNVKLGTKLYLVIHGDGLAKTDKGYRFLKYILQHKWSIFLFKTFVPADLGIWISNFISNSSRKSSNRKKINKKLDIEYVEYAEKMIKDKGYFGVIMGHTHFPILKKLNHGIYANSGDWLTNYSYLVFEDNKLNLKYWSRDNGYKKEEK